MTQQNHLTHSDGYDRKAQLFAAVATLLIVAFLTVIVLMSKLSYVPGAKQTWPPVDSSEILFGGEYVMAGDVDTPSESADEPAQTAMVESPATDGPDLADAGEPSPIPPQHTTSTQPSPMKVTPVKEDVKPGPSKAEIEAEKAKARKEKETKEKIAGRMNFGSNSSAGSGSGKTGSSEGNATSGTVSGAPGYRLDGRTLAHWVLPAKTAPNGSVTVRVVVNQQGQVIDASVASSSGAAANEAVRSACVAAAKKSAFSVKLDAPARQSGTITYKFVSK